MLNRITMTGRLVADPELRRTQRDGLFRCRGLEIHR